MLIYVLEDHDVRVKWLREFVGDGDRHEVIWTDNVVDFLRCFKVYREEPDLIILDHDLGGIPEDLSAGSLDANGETGMDAARQMPKVSCPILVWSYNSVRAPEMVAELQKRGMRAGWGPFRSLECVSVISKCLMNQTGEMYKEEDDDE